MPFQTYPFILLFLPAAAIGWRLIIKHAGVTAGQIFLLGCSLFFYGWFNPLFLPIIIVSALFNYFMARFIARAGLTGMRRLRLAAALVVNIGALVYFKYTNFFIANINAVFKTSVGFFDILLPLGISFFTFQQVAYLVDVYRGGVKRYNPLEYMLFVCFFPYVISGPIAFHDEIIPQLREPKTASWEHVSMGLTAFAAGLFKKILIADTFAKAADWGFGISGGPGGIASLVVLLSYAFQLYFDFSGYSDMARGVAFILGIKLPRNFDSPYKALTIADFWKGWHMTMTRFFTKYVYIPLGGNRKGELRTALNTVIVFLISGLWHGANWTFVVWGAMHGAAQAANRIFKKQAARLHPALSWGMTFGFVCFGWLFFRSPSLGYAADFIRGFSKGFAGGLPKTLTDFFVLPEFELLARVLRIPAASVGPVMCAVFIIGAFAVCLQGTNTDSRLGDFVPRARSAVLYAAMAFWAMISMSGVATFIYANF